MSTYQSLADLLAKYPKSFTLRAGPEPQKTLPGYRAVRLFPSRPGEVFPAMINSGISAKLPTGEFAVEGLPMGEWLQALYLPQSAAAKGIKPRKGWHAGELPNAPQFNLTRGPDAGKQPSNMVWTEADLMADKDWQALADQLGGRGDVPYLRSELPVGQGPDEGFYRYRLRPSASPWIISDAVRHNRVLTDEEVSDVLRSSGVEPTPRAGGAWTTERLRKAGFLGVPVAAGVAAPEDSKAATPPPSPSPRGEARAAPRSGLGGTLADLLLSAKSGLNALGTIPAAVPLVGGQGAGDLLLGRGPELADSMSYGFSPVRGAGMAATLDPAVVDLLSLLPGASLAKGATVAGLSRPVRGLAGQEGAFKGISKLPSFRGSVGPQDLEALRQELRQGNLPPPTTLERPGVPTPGPAYGGGFQGRDMTQDELLAFILGGGQWPATTR